MSSNKLTREELYEKWKDVLDNPETLKTLGITRTGQCYSVRYDKVYMLTGEGGILNYLEILERTLKENAI